MMLPQSSSLTTICPPGTACHPFPHHSGSVAAIEDTESSPLTICFACQASSRRMAPLAALWKVRRTSLRVPAGLLESSLYSACSVLWNVCRSFASSSREWRGRGLSVGRRLNAGLLSRGADSRLVRDSASPDARELPCSDEASGRPDTWGRGVRWPSSSSSPSSTTDGNRGNALRRKLSFSVNCSS